MFINCEYAVSTKEIFTLIQKKTSMIGSDFQSSMKNNSTSLSSCSNISNLTQFFNSNFDDKFQIFLVFENLDNFQDKDLINQLIIFQQVMLIYLRLISISVMISIYLILECQ